MLWGIHKIDFPFLRPVEWFAPYGYMIAMILFMSITVSLIIIIQRRMLLMSEKEVLERRQAQEELTYLATHDSLTGLINRYEFERRVNVLLAAVDYKPKQHALCFMDLDQFKVINDTCGHTAGDELLRQITGVLQSKVRENDTLARLGGDEFGLLMQHCSLAQAHRVADSLRRIVKNFEFLWDEQNFRIGISIGLVEINDASTDLNDLLKQADAACYMAKDLGRNRIHEYRADDLELAQRHGEMRWVTRINQALEQDRFCLYAQPIKPLGQGPGWIYELLVRMLDEQGQPIAPGEFLPAAERYGLIKNIDGWVVEHALRELARAEFMPDVELVTINLSGASLASRRFMHSIIEDLRAANISPQKICFEVTETAAIRNLQQAKVFINELKRAGCSFALDDFGSGLSSFGYLKILPVDFLKIDGLFVRDIVDDPIDLAMVKSINDIGQVMGMQTIAEFVEDDAILQQLQSLGVNYAQGFHIGRPLPLKILLQNGLQQATA